MLNTNSHTGKKYTQGFTERLQKYIVQAQYFDIKELDIFRMHNDLPMVPQEAVDDMFQLGSG